MSKSTKVEEIVQLLVADQLKHFLAIYGVRMVLRTLDAVPVLVAGSWKKVDLLPKFIDYIKTRNPIVDEVSYLHCKGLAEKIKPLITDIEVVTPKGSSGFMRLLPNKWEMAELHDVQRNIANKILDLKAPESTGAVGEGIAPSFYKSMFLQGDQVGIPYPDIPTSTMCFDLYQKALSEGGLKVGDLILYSNRLPVTGIPKTSFINHYATYGRRRMRLLPQDFHQGMEPDVFERTYFDAMGEWQAFADEIKVKTHELEEQRRDRYASPYGRREVRKQNKPVSGLLAKLVKKTKE